MQNTYFHVCPIPLKEDSIILPGNWGRILKQYSLEKGNLLVLIREQIFESVRQSQHTDKPSRLKSIFLCLSQEEAEFFRNSMPENKWNFIYEVMVLDNDKSIHVANWQKVGMLTNQDQIVEKFEQQAHEYWNSIDTDHAEAICESPIKILRVI